MYCLPKSHESELQSIRLIQTKVRYRTLARILVGLMGGTMVFLLIMPWQQTARGTGRVIAFSPTDRPQNISAPVEGRLGKWYVQEGSKVTEGDTIVEISDNDPEILSRLKMERSAVQQRLAAARLSVATSKINMDRQRHLFEKGVSVSKIIQTIQEGWGSMVDVKKDTLSKYLYRYKWEVVDKNLNPTQQLLRNHGDHTTAQVRKAVENLEVLAEMQEIVMVQRRRVKKLLTREDEIPMLFSNMTNELKAFAGFLEQYTNMAFDFGVMKRTPRVTTITKDGHVTTVESEGKEQLAIATENAEEIEDAAKKFFDILHGAIPPGEDHMPEMPNAG